MSAPAQWILGVASVVFDIDVGQRVDCLVPEGCLTDNEMQSCAFHCFPVRSMINIEEFVHM